MKITPAVRLSLGLVFLTLSIIVVAQALGLMPNLERGALIAREQLAESIALQTTLAARREDQALIQSLFDATVENNDNVQSLALRRSAGEIIYQTKTHEQDWQLPANAHSTSRYIRVPIAITESVTGFVEITFNPLKTENLYLFGVPYFILFVGFICVSSFIAFWFYIRRVLHQLDPNSVVPARVRNALNIMAEGVIIMDKREQVVLANEAICSILDLPENKIIGRKVKDLGWKLENTENDAPPWELAQISGEQHVKVRMLLNIPDKKAMIFRVNAIPIKDGKGSSQGVIASFDNITELVSKNTLLKQMLKSLGEQRSSIEAKNKELSFLASSDPLTNCFNRRTLFEYLSDYFADTDTTKLEMCVIMADIDHFKNINDSYGHNFGDEVIRLVADTLKSNTRKHDLVVRFGGEEFCILLPDTNIQTAYEVAERCRKKILDTAINDVNITSSFGVASQTFGATAPTELIHLADKALYASKASGRNRCTIWSPELEEEKNDTKVNHPSGPLTAGDAAKPAL